jgi:ABC-type lipoprotein export system ATPase subunit
MTPALAFERVTKTYPDGLRQHVVLDDVSFEIDAAAFVGVLGARRSGKSTLLRLAAGVELPSAGVVRLNGRDIAAMSALERERLLRHDLALMSVVDWQPEANERLLENIAMSSASAGTALRDARHEARRILSRVGLASRADDYVRSLSLVERARVVLARALVREPSLLLVDEPAVMPSLSERDEFFGLIRSIAKERGMTLIVASEEVAPLHGADALMSIAEGELTSTEHRAKVTSLPRRGRGVA